MIENVSPAEVLSKPSFQSLTLLLAAMAPSACPSVAMVDKLLLHGLGSREPVLSQAVVSVKTNSAMTTLCQSALITLLLKAWLAATMFQQTIQFARALVKATH